LQDIQKVYNDSKTKKIEHIGKIPVQLDFSKWPQVDAAPFDRHARLWINGKVFLNTDKTLSSLLEKMKRGKIDLTRPPTQKQIDQGIWDTYFKYSPEHPPEETLKIALKSYRGAGDSFFAIDLGSGTGRDTQELLKSGWKVLAVDSAEIALSKLTEQARKLGEEANKEKRPFGELFVRRGSFEVLDSVCASIDKVDLINSSYGLPYAGKSFELTWNQITKKLKPHGLFAGQFFGIRDDLHGKPGIATHTADEIKKMASGFEVLYWKEKEWEGQRIDGTPKHWHVFDVVLKKI
jgi:SAM-dependent methyltransferase